MQIKNKIFIIIYIIFHLSLFPSIVHADEFDISAKEISFDKENNIVSGVGDVKVTDSKGRIINAQKVTYEKSKEFLTVEGSVNFFDNDGNLINTDKATYDKINELITTFENSKLLLKEGYELTTNKILYNNLSKKITSDQNSTLIDVDGNTIYASMFEYYVTKNIFSSVGKIKVIDSKKNKYFFKELHVDTKKKEMIGSDVSVLLDQENFGVGKDSDPRFVANDIYVSKNKSNLSKGVFTVCEKRDNKCPPWSLKARKISHDRIKKTIFYEHATLKLYDVPIFYFPRFFHPDPTVKRQSGFLVPFFSNSTTVGTGYAVPYYWSISHDKDLTFTPKFYNNENLLILNEYRQAFRNAFLILDTSYTEGYKETTSAKTDGSRNHIFAKLNVDLGQDKPYESKLTFNIQKTSNDTYFRIHDINTELVDSEVTNLKNEINYSLNTEDKSLNISGVVYEDLREKTNSRYEYIAPSILFGKSFVTKKFGILNFQSNAFYKNYEINKHLSFLDNEIVWNPASYISKKGFVNNFEGIINNTNYEAKNTSDYKNEGIVNEIKSVLSFKSSFPLKKDKLNNTNIFSPNVMIRYAPGHMRNLSSDDTLLKYANLYAINKTSEIENGLSAILGFDFKINKKTNQGEKERLSVSMGQVFSPEKNKDIPSKSSLDQKMSDVVGEVIYNFSEIGNINYKFSLDHNYNDLNYSEVSTTLNFGTVNFNLDYLEEQNHVGSQNYMKTGLSLDLNENNRLSFETKKNFETDSTELYDISYQYMIDCLKAGLVYRREFYEDNDLEPKNSLMFQITFVPFGGVETPSFIKNSD